MMMAMSLSMTAQTTAQEVLQVTQLANDYFMKKYADPTVPTNVGRIRPSSLWTRAVYYEGLMALQRVDPQQRYVDYAKTWADFHQWTPRNGVKTCDADDQCCGQTYVELLPYVMAGATKEAQLAQLKQIVANLDYQMQTPNTKAPSAKGSLYGWWTWIDAIQMAMPLYVQLTQLTGDRKYLDHAMKMYRWSRNECGRGEGNPTKGLSSIPTKDCGGAMPTMCLLIKSLTASSVIGAVATDGSMLPWCAVWNCCPRSRKSIRN